MLLFLDIWVDKKQNNLTAAPFFQSSYCSFVKYTAANPSRDLSIMESNFQRNNWILSITHMFR